LHGFFLFFNPCNPWQKINMTHLPTVRGAIETAHLGVTLMHEHIFVLTPEINQNYPESWGNEDARVRNAIERLCELKAKGVDTLVDLTVTGSGRNIPRIQRIAAEVDVNIIVATGFFTCNELPPYFQLRKSGTRFCEAEPLIEMFLRDIQEGIAGTGVKAAVLKCATDYQGITKDVERVLRATAKVQLAANVPISTHTHARTCGGLDQLRIFEEEGVNPGRVIIGHCGDSTDIAYLEKLLAHGCYIGMDRFGIDTLQPFENRVDTAATLCRMGYAEKMVLSQDAACYNDWIPEESPAKVAPNWNYCHIVNDVVPALKKRGVTDAQISAMLIDNPRRIFEGIA
jgi:phosphotriesterase-related protein